MKVTTTPLPFFKFFGVLFLGAMAFEKPFFILSYLLALNFHQVAAKNASEWGQLSIYQVLTDRFATTNQSSPECWIRDYCGGTWRGIENNLDYIQGMGFEAIWISPV
jgi:alpha-amylase